MEKEKSPKEDTEPVCFYRPQHKNGFLSNFFPSPFKINGKTYPTNEHYFQSLKFEGLPEEDQLIAAKTPSEAFKLARKHKKKRKHNWEEIKNDIMHTGLTQKFTAHPQLRQKLLSTGDRQLIEHTKNDSYWADGGDGKGLNRLGQLLMRVRTELRQGSL